MLWHKHNDSAAACYRYTDQFVQQCFTKHFCIVFLESRCFCVDSAFNYVLAASYVAVDAPNYCNSTLLLSAKEADIPLLVVAFGTGSGLDKVAALSVCVAKK